MDRLLHFASNLSYYKYIYLIHHLMCIILSYDLDYLSYSQHRNKLRQFSEEKNKNSIQLFIIIFFTLVWPHSDQPGDIDNFQTFKKKHFQKNIVINTNEKWKIVPQKIVTQKNPKIIKNTKKKCIKSHQSYQIKLKVLLCIC